MCSESELDHLFAFVPLSDRDRHPSAENDAVANVPFDFVVGEMLLPAGAYAVRATEIPGLLALRHRECEYPAALVQEIRSERDTSELLFYRQKNLYFLAQVLAGSL